MSPCNAGGGSPAIRAEDAHPTRSPDLPDLEGPGRPSHTTISSPTESGAGATAVSSPAPGTPARDRNVADVEWPRRVHAAPAQADDWDRLDLALSPRTPLRQVTGHPEAPEAVAEDARPAKNLATGRGPADQSGTAEEPLPPRHLMHIGDLDVEGFQQVLDAQCLGDAKACGDATDAIVKERKLLLPCAKCGLARSRHGRTKNSVQMRCPGCHSSRTVVALLEEVASAWLKEFPDRPLAPKQTLSKRMAPGSPAPSPLLSRQVKLRPKVIGSDTDGLELGSDDAFAYLDSCETEIREVAVPAGPVPSTGRPYPSPKAASVTAAIAVEEAKPTAAIIELTEPKCPKKHEGEGETLTVVPVMMSPLEEAPPCERAPALIKTDFANEQVTQYPATEEPSSDVVIWEPPAEEAMVEVVVHEPPADEEVPLESLADAELPGEAKGTQARIQEFLERLDRSKVRADPDRNRVEMDVSRTVLQSHPAQVEPPSQTEATEEAQLACSQAQMFEDFRYGVDEAIDDFRGELLQWQARIEGEVATLARELQGEWEHHGLTVLKGVDARLIDAGLEARGPLSSNRPTRREKVEMALGDARDDIDALRRELGQLRHELIESRRERHEGQLAIQAIRLEVIQLRRELSQSQDEKELLRQSVRNLSQPIDALCSGPAELRARQRSPFEASAAARPGDVKVLPKPPVEAVPAKSYAAAASTAAGAKSSVKPVKAGATVFDVLVDTAVNAAESHGFKVAPMVAAKPKATPLPLPDSSTRLAADAKPATSATVNQRAPKPNDGAVVKSHQRPTPSAMPAAPLKGSPRPAAAPGEQPAEKATAPKGPMQPVKKAMTPPAQQPPKPKPQQQQPKEEPWQTTGQKPVKKPAVTQMKPRAAAAPSPPSRTAASKDARSSRPFSAEEMSRILRGQGPKPTRRIVAVFAVGLRSNRIGTYKRLFQSNCGVSPTMLPHIGFIGQSILELHTYSDYVDELKRRLAEGLRPVLSEFCWLDIDPLSPSLIKDPSTADVITTAALKYKARLEKRVAGAPTEAAKRFIKNEIARADLQIETGKHSPLRPKRDQPSLLDPSDAEAGQKDAEGALDADQCEDLLI